MTGVGAVFWMNLQTNFDLGVARGKTVVDDDGAPKGDGAATFDAAVQRAFAGSGVEVRTSFTPVCETCGRSLAELEAAAAEGEP